MCANSHQLKIKDLGTCATLKGGKNVKDKIGSLITFMFW